MKTLVDFIENLRAKPHHVRKQIAFTAAGAGAALVGIVWVGVSLSLGTYALRGDGAFAAADAQSGAAVASTQVAGAAAAVDSGAAASPSAGIEIIDAATSSAATTSEPTVIPF